ncbi:hypothetical protein L596_001205 [Steinernema carpocapsae]|uniref:Uncharacterized protein n=1 Tax=Steinernema carpocapsae TaxID=34508 RepID=A0A4U8ULL5_STECR|nr:hypothetical protein L596_001205 [Steinernema carpocapsae]
MRPLVAFDHDELAILQQTFITNYTKHITIRSNEINQIRSSFFVAVVFVVFEYCSGQATTTTTEKFSKKHSFLPTTLANPRGNGRWTALNVFAELQTLSNRLREGHTCADRIGALLLRNKRVLVFAFNAKITFSPIDNCMSTGVKSRIDIVRLGEKPVYHSYCRRSVQRTATKLF